MRCLKLLFAISVPFLFAFNEAIAQQGTYQLSEVLALRYFDVTQGDPDAYEQLVKDVSYPFVDRHMPGLDWLLMKGDRGVREGSYAWAYNTTLERRNYYWPQEQEPFPNWEPIMEKWNAEVGEDRFSAFSFDEKHVGDYVLIGSETLTEMPWVGLLGLHHITVKAGQEAAFERFVTEEWNPHSHLPGWWILFYKADRGDRAGEYLLVHALEQPLLRDAYFPEGQESEMAVQAMRPVEKLSEALTEYLEPGSDWTDYVLVR